jgi:hypothetical protein
VILFCRVLREPGIHRRIKSEGMLRLKTLWDSDADELGLLEYVLVAGRKPRLVHDDRQSSGFRGGRPTSPQAARTAPRSQGSLGLRVLIESEASAPPGRLKPATPEL